VQYLPLPPVRRRWRCCCTSRRAPCPPATGSSPARRWATQHMCS